MEKIKRMIKFVFWGVFLFPGIVIEANAALIHQLTFNDGTASDSVGNAEGVLHCCRSEQ